MITLTTTKAKLLFVEVPDDVRNIEIHKGYILSYEYGEKNCDIQPFIKGSTYTFLFTTKQGREEDWKPLVGEKIFFFEEVYMDYEDEDKYYWTATESGLSLQKANGMDVNKNYAVIEVKN